MEAYIGRMQDIRATRRNLGVTQAELAQLLGLNQSTISRLESGSLPVDERTALAVEALVARHAAHPTELTAPAEQAAA